MKADEHRYLSFVEHFKSAMEDAGGGNYQTAIKMRHYVNTLKEKTLSMQFA